MNLHHFNSFDFTTRPNVHRRETEREYFMRLIREQKIERALAKRQERVRKVKSFLRKISCSLQKTTFCSCQRSDASQVL